MKKYLTNIHNSRKLLVAEAIAASGRTDIHIDNLPMGKYSELNSEYFSIYVVSMYNNYVDCSNFWQKYRELEKSQRWQTYFNLIHDK